MADCNLCALRRTCSGPVWGEGDPRSPYWLIGEAPGETEDHDKRPFVGKAGEELNGNYLLRNGLGRDLFYITNLVKCRPPANRDPKPEEISACWKAHLECELQKCCPEAVIGTLGRFASREVLGKEIDMSMYHGVPLRALGRIVVPIFHPALGLHSTSMMTHITGDFKALAAVIKGDLRPEDYQDPLPNPVYTELRRVEPGAFPPAKVVGIDTESVGPLLWSIQFAYRPGTAWFIRADNTGALEWLRSWLGPDTLVVLHNAQHDLPMLAQAGVYPPRWTDTMFMANLLQDVPKGLKALAFRLCYMRMNSYSSLVDPITEERALGYLARVAQYKWKRPEPEQILENGEYRLKQPWAMHTVAKSILSAYARGNCKGYDLYKRWHGNPNRFMAEDIFGPLEAATIADVDPATAVYYGCQDADATLRVYYQLYPRISMANLIGPLERDCRAVPMVVDMRASGMAVDIPHLIELGESYEDRKLKVIEEIKDLVGVRICPGSAPQVADLLFNRLGLKPKRRTGTGKNSTDESVLELLKDKHKAVPLILEYRRLDKDKGTFVDGVLESCRRSSDKKRCHTDISLIRTATGRFAASNPNLLAFPQEDRSEEGKALRDSFVAADGHVFLSGDWSQIELRVLADQSNEPTMQDLFWNGIDIHLGMAAKVHKIPLDQVTAKQRYGVKKVNFGIPYGITILGLFKFLEPEGWDKKGCERLIDEWFENFPAVYSYMSGIHQFARRYGYVVDFCGRRRLIPEVRSVHQFVREAGLRQAGNMPIQTGANSILKEAMGQLVPIYKHLRGKGHYIAPLLPIHDDLLWEIDASILPWFVPTVKAVMENCVTLSVPLVVDFKVGTKWGSMEKYKV